MFQMENKQNTLRVETRMSYHNMTQRDEEALVDARKEFYANANVNNDVVPKLQFVGKTFLNKNIIQLYYFSKICDSFWSAGIFYLLLDIWSLILLQ